MNEVQIYTWIGMIVFLIVLVVLGYYSAKKTKSIEDYAISGANLGPYVLGLAFAATFLSAGTYLGYVGWSYAWGLGNLWIFLTLIGTGPLGVIVVGKKVRQLNTKQRSLSLPDWLGDYYNSDFLRVGTGLIMMFNVFYIAMQLTAGALIFEMLLGIPYIYGLIITTVVVIAYVFAGGTYADVYTDVFQVILMVAASILIFVSGIYFFGNGSFTNAFSNIASNLASQDVNLVKVFNPMSSEFSALTAVLGVLIIQFAFASQPQLFNKVLALKRTEDLGKMLTTYLITVFLCSLAVVGGLYARVAVPGLEFADQALFEYLAWGFPAIVIAFVGVVILAAALSTTDGIFIAMSTVFANDIYRKFLVKRGFIKADEEKANRVALTISRWSVVFIALVAFFIVLRPPQLIGILGWIAGGGVASGTLGPILYAVFSKNRKASARAAEISAIGGFISFLVLYFGGIEDSIMAAGAWSVLIGVAIMWIAAALFKNRVPVSKEKDNVL